MVEISSAYLQFQELLIAQSARCPRGPDRSNLLEYTNTGIRNQNVGLRLGNVYVLHLITLTSTVKYYIVQEKLIRKIFIEHRWSRNTSNRKESSPIVIF